MLFENLNKPRFSKIELISCTLSKRLERHDLLGRAEAVTYMGVKMAE